MRRTETVKARLAAAGLGRAALVSLDSRWCHFDH
jgi:hypothetical protein